MAAAGTPTQTRKEIAGTLLEEFFAHPFSVVEQTQLAGAFAGAVINEPSLDEKRDLTDKLYRMLSQTGNAPEQQKEMIRGVKNPAPDLVLTTFEHLMSNPAVAQDAGEMSSLRQITQAWQHAHR